jgi:hypothetical protein
MLSHSVIRAKLDSWTPVGKLALILLMAGAIFIVVACGGSDDGEVEDVLKVRRLELVDQNGVPRAMIEMLDNGMPSIVLIDDRGVFRSLLFLSDDGSPNLVMVDSPRFALMDQNNEIRAAQHLNSDGQPAFSLSDSTGQVRSEIRLGQDGSPSIRLFDDEGEVLWTPPPVESKQEP